MVVGVSFRPCGATGRYLVSRKGTFIMKKVLWISRHKMTPEQLAAVDNGRPVEIDQEEESVNDVRDLTNRINNADVVAVVLPPNLLMPLVRMINGKRPIIRAISERRVLDDGSASFKFIKWEKVIEFKIVTEDWIPN